MEQLIRIGETMIGWRGKKASSARNFSYKVVATECSLHKKSDGRNVVRPYRFLERCWIDNDYLNFGV